MTWECKCDGNGTRPLGMYLLLAIEPGGFGRAKEELHQDERMRTNSKRRDETPKSTAITHTESQCMVRF